MNRKSCGRLVRQSGVITAWACLLVLISSIVIPVLGKGRNEFLLWGSGKSDSVAPLRGMTFPENIPIVGTAPNKKKWTAKSALQGRPVNEHDDLQSRSKSHFDTFAQLHGIAPYKKLLRGLLIANKIWLGIAIEKTVIDTYFHVFGFGRTTIFPSWLHREIAGEQGIIKFLPVLKIILPRPFCGLARMQYGVEIVDENEGARCSSEFFASKRNLTSREARHTAHFDTLPPHLDDLISKELQSANSGDNAGYSNGDQNEVSIVSSPVVFVLRGNYGYGGRNRSDLYDTFWLLGLLLAAIVFESFAVGLLWVNWDRRRGRISGRRGRILCRIGWLLGVASLGIWISICLSGPIGCLPMDWAKCINDPSNYHQNP